MAGSKSFRKKASGSLNVVVSDSESEYREERMEITATTTSSRKSSRSSTRRSRVPRRPSASKHHRIKHFVEHNYHDHKRDPVEVITNDTQKGIPKRTGHKGGVSTPFPDKLHELLENVGHQGKDDIIGWQPHGRAFVVHKPKEFVSEVMPRFFKQSKLTSFQRQLNLYGFSRLTTGPDRGGYYHELFIRGRSDLCSRMVRTRVKGNGSKAASSPSTEPNFYGMEPCLAEDAASAIDSPMVVEAANGNDIQFFQDNDLEEDLSMVETPESLPERLPGTPGVFVDEEDSSTVASKGALLWNERNEECLGVSDMVEMSSQAKFTSLPPVVTPVATESRRVLGDADGVPPMLPMVASLDSIESQESLEGIHSGDQVFFEGLPFHYLELKDIELHCV